ncbi:MAG: sulfatase [Gemmatimonadota bacterium]|nr:sulfatase [Gemmatimonadota bacterium]
MRPRATAAWVLGAAGVTALGTGLVQAAVLVWRAEFSGDLIWHSRDYPWMAPAAYVLLFTSLVPAVLGCLTLVGRARPATDGRRITSAFFCFLGAFALLLLWHRLHPLAQVTLAAGVAVQVSPLLARRTVKAVAVAAFGLAIVVAGLGLGGRAWRSLAERRALAALPAAPDEAPNILLVILDTVRAASLNLYGYERLTSPALTRWATDGVTFERAISSSSWTLPSHATMFTGRDASELTADWRVPLDAAFPTVAELFRDNGYVTAAFVANTYYAGHDSGLDRGFVRYEDYRTTLEQVIWSSTLAQTNLGRALIWSRSWSEVWQALKSFDTTTPILLIAHRKRGASVTENFLVWQAGQQARPFFAFLNYFDAHEKYDPPPRYRQLFSPNPEKKELYEGSIRYLDDQLERLFSTLRRRGVLDNTVVVVTSDHGEQFSEHGLWGHGNALYMQLIHVPLVVRYPISVPASRRVRDPVSLGDLPATLLDLAQLASPRMPGRSLARFWQPRPAVAHSELIGSYLTSFEDAWLARPRQRKIRSLVTKDLHWIRGFDGREQLYAHWRDPEERYNLVTDPSAKERLDSLRTADTTTPRN